MKLHEQRDELQRRLDRAADELRTLDTYLKSGKFAWPDDYVRTHEVHARINMVLDILHGYEEQEYDQGNS